MVLPQASRIAAIVSPMTPRTWLFAPVTAGCRLPYASARLRSSRALVRGKTAFARRLPGRRSSASPRGQSIEECSVRFRHELTQFPCGGRISRQRCPPNGDKTGLHAVSHETTSRLPEPVALAVSRCGRLPAAAATAASGTPDRHAWPVLALRSGPRSEHRNARVSMPARKRRHPRALVSPGICWPGSVSPARRHDGPRRMEQAPIDR